MKLVPWLKRSALVLLACMSLSTAANAQTVLAEDNVFLGDSPQFTKYLFNIVTPGTYQVVLGDIGGAALPSFESLAAIVSLTGFPTPGTSLGAPGVSSFAATAGNYSALVIGDPQGLGGAYSISVSLVPEPETLAMMIAGFGLIGFKLWRRLKARDMGMALRT